MEQSESYIQKNKDWNVRSSTKTPLADKSESYIQKNKDWNINREDLPALIATIWILYPEEQGLKLVMQICGHKMSKIWILYPEEQGLKQQVEWTDEEKARNLNPISRRTRIETIRAAPHGF